MIKQVTADRVRAASNELSDLYTKLFKIEQLTGRKHTTGREKDAKELAESLSISDALLECADLNIPIWDLKRSAQGRAERLIDSWSRVLEDE